MSDGIHEQPLVALEIKSIINYNSKNIINM